MIKPELKKKAESGMSRKEFIGKAAIATVGFTIVPRHVLGGPGYIAPSDKLNIAAVGIGGMGRDNVANVAATENIVALCDVDMDYADKVFKKYPNAKRYWDYRKMLDREKDIDAVIIATPDHTHAVITNAAMKLGKHVFTQKPLTKTIFEARTLRQTANETGVATQMGNQGHSGEGNRLMVEWIRDGAIGKVHKVECWTNRPWGWWEQGIERPEDTPKVPKTLNWDLWQGPAPERPYNPAYLPFRWRGWWDYGTGALGDMGCHILDTPVWALDLGYPSSVEAQTTPVNNETGPNASVVTYQFPSRGDKAAVTLMWYDGGLKPTRPDMLEEGRRMGDTDGGVLFHGDKGIIMCGVYGSNPRLIPETAMKAYKRPAKTIKRIKNGHEMDWVAACKGGDKASSNFDVSSVLTEIVLLGNLAIRSQKHLKWDGPNMRVTNYEPANQFVHREYRKGWTL